MAEFDWANYDWGQGTPGLMARPKNDAMSMGLLAAGLGILANNRGNYGKLAPALGAGGLAGLSTYQNMLQQQRDNQMRDEQMARAAKLGDLQMRKGNLEIGQMEEGANRRRKILEELQGGQPTQPVQQPYSPAVSAAFGLPQQATTQAAPQARNSQFDSLMRQAGVYEKYGDIEAANKLRETAIKLMPNVKDTRTAIQDGKPVTVIQYADGREEVSPFQPTPKMQYQTLGDRVLPIDEYNPANSGVRAGSPLMMGQSPDSKASNALGWANNRLAQDRFKFDKEKEAKPTFNAELGAFVVPPSKGGQFGSVIPVMGTDNKPIPTKDKAMTEYQSKSSAFGMRMQNADEILQKLEGKYNPVNLAAKSSAENMPLFGGISGMAANKLLSESDQKAEQAQRDFITAALRLESGATIQPYEFQDAKIKYFPQPGDKPEVIEQKRLARAIAIDGFRNSAGSGASKIAPTYNRPNQSSGKITPTPKNLSMMSDQALLDAINGR